MTIQPIQFNIVNLRNLVEDGLELNFAITSNNGPTDPATTIISNASVDIQMNTSYPLSIFTGDTMELGMNFINSGRMYFGYGQLPNNVSGSTAPIPEGDQYYGWIEFSRKATDMCLWINLSNVDIVALPIALSSSTWSLGYKNPVTAITNTLATSYPGCSVVCKGGTKTKIVAPGINNAPYPRFDDYLSSLYTAGSDLCINSDTLSDGTQKQFVGYFMGWDPEPCIFLESNSGDTFLLSFNQFTNDIVYRGDGGTITYNGVVIDQNRSGSTDDVISSNSVFRNLVIGMNEGYFETNPTYSDGTNYSMNYSYLKPFGENGDKGSMYAKIIHENSNSYGFAYSDSNLKTLIQSPLNQVVDLYIVRDDDASGLCYVNNESSTTNCPGLGPTYISFGQNSDSLGNIRIGNCNYPATLPNVGTAGVLPWIDGYVEVRFMGTVGADGKPNYILVNTKTLDFIVTDENGNACLTGGNPTITDVNNAKGQVIGKQLTWGANISWNAGSGNAYLAPPAPSPSPSGMPS